MMLDSFLAVSNYPSVSGIITPAVYNGTTNSLKLVTNNTIVPPIFDYDETKFNVTGNLKNQWVHVHINMNLTMGKKVMLRLLLNGSSVEIAVGKHGRISLIKTFQVTAPSTICIQLVQTADTVTTVTGGSFIIAADVLTSEIPNCFRFPICNVRLVKPRKIKHEQKKTKIPNSKLKNKKH